MEEYQAQTYLLSSMPDADLVSLVESAFKFSSCFIRFWTSNLCASSCWQKQTFEPALKQELQIVRTFWDIAVVTPLIIIVWIFTLNIWASNKHASKPMPCFPTKHNYYFGVISDCFKTRQIRCGRRALRTHIAAIIMWKYYFYQLLLYFKATQSPNVKSKINQL